MIIQVNSDSSVEGSRELSQQIKAIVASSLERYGEHITRVEVHLSDENSAEKSGTDDMRCLLEARLAGLEPLAVSDEADTLEQALDGAVEKLIRAIDTTLGKLDDRYGATPPSERTES